MSGALRGYVKRPVIRAIIVATALIGTLGGLGASGTFRPSIIYQPTPYTVAGENYQICNTPSFLTSPWTYDALPAGSSPVQYTASQYEALPGYGTTLPPLPSYLTGLSGNVAEIFAPGTGAGISQYNGTELYFLEGGAYPGASGSLVSGDEVIGGSAPGYSEPLITESGGPYSDFGGENAHWNTAFGYGQVATSVTNSTTITASSSALYSPGGYPTNIIFADGTTAGVSSISGSTITLGSAVTENAGTNFWLYASQLGSTTAAAAAGATTISVTTNTSFLPYVPYDQISLAATLPNGEAFAETVDVKSISGNTLTLMAPLAQAVPNGAPVMYDGSRAGIAGDVTIEYLNIGYGTVSNNPVISPGGMGWVIEHNDIHDAYAGGTAYKHTNAAGTAIMPPSYTTVEYNCFQRLGEYAWNGGGVGSIFDYNEVTDTPYNPDLSGNGQTGIGKWWGTVNNDIKDNAFINDNGLLWFDNGNTGQLVEGNFFENIPNRAVQNETGWNSAYINNFFENVSQGIYLNSSGGWNIVGSRFNGYTDGNVNDGSCPSGATNGCILIEGNVFYNVVDPVNIWQSSGRSTLSSGEYNPPPSNTIEETSANYAADGFPNNPPPIGTSSWSTTSSPITTVGSFYASHYSNSNTGAGWGVVAPQTCTSSTPCGTTSNPLLLTGGGGYGSMAAPTLNDWIGFSAAAATSTSDTTNVSTFTGSGVINATTTNFPTSGQLMVSTSGGSDFAVVSYSATTSSQFQGVNLIRGSGTLSGNVEEVQPYQVTGLQCPGGNCTNNAEVTTNPTITTNLTAGEAVYNTGTCRYYAPGSSPSGPLDPSGNPYYDDCQWQTRNITVSGNTFNINASQFNATPYPWGGTWGAALNNGAGCVVGTSGNCAQIATGYQYNNGGVTYQGPIESNAMMSVSTFASPLNNLNASGSPFVGGSTGINPNPEAPYNDVFQDNTYIGTWTFTAYNQAVTCAVSWSGTALEWGTAGTNACYGLTLSQWQTYWGQDAGSTQH